MQTRQERIESILTQKFSPSLLEVENESHMHSGPRTESHFKVLMVSKKFSDLSRVEKQRLVMEALKEDFSKGLHALSMRLFSEAEYESKKTHKFKSPDCSLTGPQN